MIEEIPEKEKIPKRQEQQKDRSKPTKMGAIEKKEITKMPRKEVMEHDPKLYKEYTADYEERPWERGSMDERVTTYTERLRQVINISMSYNIHNIIVLVHNI